MNRYRWMPLSQVLKYEPAMKKKKVSITARSTGGFLWWYKRVKGRRERLPDRLWKKRESFIARTLAQYEKRPTYRRFLSLIAWAYLPDIKMEEA